MTILPWEFCYNYSLYPKTICQRFLLTNTFSLPYQVPPFLSYDYPWASHVISIIFLFRPNYLFIFIVQWFVIVAVSCHQDQVCRLLESQQSKLLIIKAHRKCWGTNPHTTSDTCGDRQWGDGMAPPVYHSHPASERTGGAQHRAVCVSL